MRWLVRLAVVVSATSTIMSSAVSAEPSLTRRDDRGPVSVRATLLAAREPGTPLKVKIDLDTHSVGLDGLVLEDVVVLRAPDGTDMPPIAVEQVKGSGHHREGVVVFAPVQASAPIRVVVKDVGGVAERVFTWDPPAGR